MCLSIKERLNRVLKTTIFLPFLFSLLTLCFVQPVLAADTITITSPVSYQVIQRNSSNQANITITGTYTGSPTAIEASWNSGSYLTIVASPTGGTFSGTLSSQTAGQGALTVRFTNNTSVSVSTAYVGIGDVFIIAGQSNADGYGFSNQTYSHPTFKAGLFGKDDVWKNLTDPVGDGTNAIDAVTGQLGQGGSVWPPLATILMANQNVPIAFVPSAKNGGAIAPWARNNSNPGDTTTLYGSMYRRINAVGGVKAVLWWQGESDRTTGQSIYKTALTQLANNIYSDFGIKLVVAQIGDWAGVAGAGLDSVRLAQVSAWNDGGNILPGPALYDINLSDESGDGLHFKSDGDVQIAANRWGAAVLKDIYGIGDARGPQLSVAEYDSTKTKVTLTFADDSMPILPASGFSGFTVNDNGTAATISSITKISASQLLITLETSASGTITVSLGQGHTGTAVTVPTDSSTYNLPAEIFVDHATTLDVSPTISSVSNATTNNGATIIWTTNENSSTKVDYGTTSAYGNSTSETDLSSMISSHSISFNDLSSCTSYHFRARSRDPSLNETISQDNILTTAGCPGSNAVDPNIKTGWSYKIMAGPNYVGLSSYISGTDETQFYISPTAHHDDVYVTVNKQSINNLVDQKIPFPWAQGLNTVSDIYNFNAVSAFNGYPIPEFDNPTTIILKYDSTKLNGRVPNQLRIAWYDTNSKKWKVLKNNTVVNPLTNTISNTTKNFSYFAIVYPADVFGQTVNTNKEKKDIVPTPSPISSPIVTIIPQLQKSNKRCIWFVCF